MLSSRGGSKGLSTLESMVMGLIAGKNPRSFHLVDRFDLGQAPLPQ